LKTRTMASAGARKDRVKARNDVIVEKENKSLRK
jgi:hypothetical protein